MNMAKLQQDILRCKEVVSSIHIKMYESDEYREVVDGVFSEIFKDYFTCPDKIEPENYDS
jgi:hypothetical protein